MRGWPVSLMLLEREVVLWVHWLPTLQLSGPVLVSNVRGSDLGQSMNKSLSLW